MTDVVPAESKKVVAQAQTLGAEIREGAAAIEKAWLLMGQKLYEFEQLEGWRHDGSDSGNFREWCGQPGCPSYSYARQLIQIHRTYCVNFGLPVKKLVGASVQGLLAARGAVESGKVEPDQAVSDAEVTSVSDMKALYNGGRRNEDGGPTLARCENCGSLVPEERIGG